MHPIGQLLIPQKKVISEPQPHDAAAETFGNGWSKLIVVSTLAAATFAAINRWILTPAQVNASYEGLIDQIHIECSILPILEDVIQIFIKVLMYYKAYRFTIFTQEAATNPLQPNPGIFGVALQH